MRDEHFVAGALEHGLERVQGRVELDGAYYGEGFTRGEISLQRREQVGRVDADVDEDVEGRDFGDRDGDEAAVRVVHEEVAPQGPRGVVVDAAGAVGDVGHDEGFGARAEAGDYVGDGGGEEEEAFGELEGDLFGEAGPDAVDGFGELEAVVGGEEGYCGCYVGVVEDLRGYLV